MEIKVHQDLQKIYYILFIKEVKGQNWYPSVFSIYVITNVRIWPDLWTKLSLTFLKWVRIKNILFLHNNSKVLYVKDPERLCFKKREKRHRRQFPVDWTRWSWGLLRVQGGIHRAIVVSVGWYSLSHWENVRGWESSCPLGANSVHWVCHDKWASFMKETLLFWKAPILARQPENPNVLETPGRRGLNFLLVSSKELS